MFTTLIEQIIDGVQDAKKSFVDTYYTEAAKAPANAFVESQRTFAKSMVRSTTDFVEANQRAIKEATKA